MIDGNRFSNDGLNFYIKDGFLYSYVPRENIDKSRFYLYCWKTGCKAKVKIDMNSKSCEVYGEHISHRSIAVDKFANEYPGLLDKDWEHIQYDIKGKDRILVWKI